MFKTELLSSGLPRRLSLLKFVFNFIFLLQINPFINLSFYLGISREAFLQRWLVWAVLDEEGFFCNYRL